MRKWGLLSAIVGVAMLATLSLGTPQADAGRRFVSWWEKIWASEQVYEGELVAVDPEANTITISVDGKVMTFETTLSPAELAGLRVGEKARVTTRFTK